MPASAVPPLRQTPWTARDGKKRYRQRCRSFRLLLSPGFQLSERPFELLNIVRGQFSGVGKLRHQRRGLPAEEAQYLVEQAISGHLPGDERLEDIGITVPLDAAHCALPFHPIDNRLDSGVGGARFGEEPVNVANRSLFTTPEGFQYAELELAEFRPGHVVLLLRSCRLLLCRGATQEIFSRLNRCRPILAHGEATATIQCL